MAQNEYMQFALDDAAELIRESYPKIDSALFAKTQAWFGRYQHLLSNQLPKGPVSAGDA